MSRKKFILSRSMEKRKSFTVCSLIPGEPPGLFQHFWSVDARNIRLWMCLLLPAYQAYHKASQSHHRLAQSAIYILNYAKANLSGRPYQVPGVSESADSNCPGHCVQWPAAVPRWLRCAHCSQHLPGCEPRPQPQHCPPSALPRTPLSPAPGLTCCPAGQQHLIIDNLLTSLKSTALLVITPEICIIMAETGTL